VENSSLVVWLLVLLVVHGGDVRGRARWMLSSAPWVAALIGAALTRSGSAPSVHSFAGQRAVGWSLLVLAVVTAVIGVLLRATTAPDADAAAVSADWVDSDRGSRRAHAAINLAVVGLVVLGTVVPVLRSFGDGEVAVRGVFFSRTVAPLALVAALFIVPRLRSRRGRLAHIGVLVLLAGIGASTFDRAAAVGLSNGQRATVAGLVVVAGPVEVVDGPRRDVQAVQAALTVDGVKMLPSLVAYPERGGVLAETAVHSTPWRDIQVTLNDATDDQRMLVVIRQRPLVWLVWIGAALMSSGSLPGLPSLGWRRRSVVSQSSS
jgi:cytochrome c biogenesis factor